MTPCCRVRTLVSFLTLTLLLAPMAFAADSYPPTLPESSGDRVVLEPTANKAGIIFTNTHNYGDVEIHVELYDNYFGDTSKYHWKYIVRNVSYDPPAASTATNGFSGFELALAQFVADLDNLAAPSAAWEFNAYSGQPVEWDLKNSLGTGLMPGELGIFSFTTLPRFITISGGWYHSWEDDLQVHIVNFPDGEGPESPDLQDEIPPDLEYCCYFDDKGKAVCQPVPVGECNNRDGTVVKDCGKCDKSVDTEDSTWGTVKSKYRQ